MSKSKLYACAAAAMVAFGARAVPAKPTPITIIQPDGSEITVTLRGDERSHWYTTEDGYVLISHNDALVYATVGADGKLAPSAFTAQNPGMRTAAAERFLASVDKATVGEALNRRIASSPRMLSEQKRRAAAAAKSQSRAAEDSYGVGLFPGSTYPSKGSPHAAVILVEYSDVKFSTPNPQDYFTRMLNEPGFSDYGGTGSALDFFTQNSNGQFTPQFDLLGPVTLPNNRKYYGGNDRWGDDLHPEEMAIHACNILDATVDFSKYDTDGDGYIDNVFIFYAGRGEADGGGENTVWQHAWNVSNSGTYVYDGVRLGQYACSNEWTGSRPDGIGTFVHEFSHVMGLPDLYATDYSSAFTPGAYSALDYGPYNNDGCTPPNYGAFERNALGWMQPEIITESTGIGTLPPITENKAYLIPTGKGSEFFLLENRQKTGWDTFIPGHGMLIWHIDYNTSVWALNEVNNTITHQYVDIEEADGTQTEASQAGDTWPGTAGKTEFSMDTRPALKTWAGKGIDLPIRNITESGGEITFTVGDGPVIEPGAVTAHEVPAEAVTATTFVARWTSDPYATTYCIEVTDADGKHPDKWKYADVGNITAVTVDGLEPSTEYSYKVWAVNRGTAGPESNSVKVTTTDATIDFYTTYVLDATEITDSSFIANWKGIDIADNYLLTVQEYIALPGKTDTVDFRNGLALPAGWTTDAMFVYSSSHYGHAPSALRFTSNGYVQSPTYGADIDGFSFWYCGDEAQGGSKLLVKGYDAATRAWATLATYTITDDEPQTADFSQLPAGVRRIRLEYERGSGKEYLALDDIFVSYDGTRSGRRALPEYDNLSVGNVTSYLITGLNPCSKYVYTVQAVCGSLKAKVSGEAIVTTGEEGGNSGIQAPAVLPYALNGRTLTASEPVSVYAVDGRHVATGIDIDLRPGIYVVRTATAAAKLLVR